MTFTTKCQGLNTTSTLKSNQWKTLSEQTINQAWQRLNSMPESTEKKALQTARAICGRIGEVIAIKTAGDKTAHPTGEFLTVEIKTYTPNLRNKQELSAWIDTKLHTEYKMPNLEEIMKIKEQFAVFRVTTEKRLIQKKGETYIHGWIRECARPMNPLYDPTTKPIVDYILKQQAKGQLLFPVDRKKMWATASEILEGLQYTIQPYLKAKRDPETGEYLRNPDELNRYGKPKLLMELVMEHEKDAANHAIRHWSRQELEDFYGFTTKEADAFGGWTQTEGANVQGQRYVKIPWNNYAPRLLIPYEKLNTF